MIIKSATLDRVNRKADRSISLHFTTALEQTSEELKELDENLGSCIVALKPNESEFEYNELDKLDTVDIEVDQKSKCQRMRSTLWKRQQTELGRKPSDSEFKIYYDLKYEQMLEHHKKFI